MLTKYQRNRVKKWLLRNGACKCGVGDFVNFNKFGFPNGITLFNLLRKHIELPKKFSCDLGCCLFYHSDFCIWALKNQDKIYKKLLKLKVL